MLHENPLMLDIDVDHWRNLQALLLDSAKERRRIIVIHENGEIVKFVHSGREEIVRSVDRVDDPAAVAERVYRDNPGKADFVAVFERRAFDAYFARFQAAWRPDEDLDVFVHRTYALLDEFRDGLVTYPGEARHTLGLQWRIGTPYEQIVEAAAEIVPPRSTVVFGVFEGDALWATLVLHFDEALRVDVVTTVDTSRLTVTHGREALAEEVVAWASARYGPCSLGLFADLADARAFLGTPHKRALLQELAEKGALIASPVPDTLPLAPFAAAR